MIYKKIIYIIYILTLSFCITGITNANEIGDRRSAKLVKIDAKKDLLSKDKSQSIGNIYSISKNIYITDTMKVNSITMGQIINYIKNGQKDCTIETGDIINVMSYDEDFDFYMKLITNGEKLKALPGSASYYSGQLASCVRVFGCLQKTNKLISLVNNTNITSANLSKVCSESIPSLYNRLNNNDKIYFDLNNQKIGNELYVNGDETDSAFDILVDIKYIGDVMYWGNEDPSKIFVHDIDKLKSELKKQQDVDASLGTTHGATISYKPSTDDMVLLAQNTNTLDQSSTDLLQDPDIKKLLGDSIYNNLKNVVLSFDTGANISDRSFIKSYVNNVNKGNTLQDKTVLQEAWQKANPVSNSGDALSVSKSSDSSKKNTLKECLKSCLNAKTASDNNMCRNSCLCGQAPKDGGQTGADGKAGSFNSIMVVRYCVQTLGGNTNIENKKQTIEGLLMEIQDILQTINDKDITPRTISRESFDFDLMLADFAKEFQFSVNTFTKDVASKCQQDNPEYITQLDKVNSDEQNPANPELKKSKSDLRFGQIVNCYILQNLTFRDNMEKTVDNIKQTANNLRNKLND